jgi:hypothetical protein
VIVYLYRWKLKADKEKQFEQAWAYVTQQLREKCGSLVGSDVLPKLYNKLVLGIRKGQNQLFLKKF